MQSLFEISSPPSPISPSIIISSTSITQMILPKPIPIPILQSHLTHLSLQIIDIVAMQTSAIGNVQCRDNWGFELRMDLSV